VLPDRALDYHALTDHLRTALPARARRRVDIDDHHAAAVAVLLVERAGVPHLPFTVRSAELRKHSGQISFPGGRVDPGETYPQAARRETREELGIAEDAIAVLGELDDVPTPTGYTIRPIVCTLPGENALYEPNPAEVAEVFEVPLATFTDERIRRDMGEREWRGHRYRLHAYDVGDRNIWGATARIVEQLVGLLAPA